MIRFDLWCNEVLDTQFHWAYAPKMLGGPAAADRSEGVADKKRCRSKVASTH